MIMCGHEGADDAAIGHVHAGKKRGGAMTLIVVRHGSATSLLPRQPGLCAVQGLDLTLFIHRNHYGPSRGMEIQGHHIFQFLGKARVVLNLNLFTRCGFRPCVRQMRPMVEGLTAVSGAKVRVLQWVAATGVDWVVSRTISSTRAGGMVRGRPERGASLSSPAIPCSTNRFRQRLTVCRTTPTVWAIS